MTSPAEWVSFLKKYAVAASPEEWPGNIGASEEQLSTAEARLKVKLPPSYRAFLAASNGWRRASAFIPVLRRVEDIRWFRKEHRDWAEAYITAQEGIDQQPVLEQQYFSYGTEDSGNFNVNHLAHAVCISEVGDSAVLLLNPMVVWPDGEWETWFFANWLPGATRYRSFADWMRHELSEFTSEPFEHTKAEGELPTVYLDSPLKAKRRVRRREDLPDLDMLLQKLVSNKNRERAKAAKQLSRIGGPRAINALLDALKVDADPTSVVKRPNRLDVYEHTKRLKHSLWQPTIRTLLLQRCLHLAKWMMSAARNIF